MGAQKSPTSGSVVGTASTPKKQYPAGIPDHILKFGRSLMGVLMIWLLGYYGVSHAWVIAGYVVYVFWCKKIADRKKKWKELRFFSDYENLKNLENIPSWLCFPDVENAEWVNTVIAQMWPFVKRMFHDTLKNNVELEIQKTMPTNIPLLKSFQFVEADLGNHPLVIGGIKVYKDHIRKDEIIIDLYIDYAGDLDVKVGFGAVTAGVSKVQLRGKLRVELKPLIPRSPLIGGISVSFLEVPEFDFDLTNILNVLDMPGVSHIFHECIEEVIESYIVLPNKISIPLVDDKEVEQALLYQPPMGILQVKIIEGKNLKASDKKIFSKDSSDPYVICKVASHKHQTAVLSDSLNPVWNDSFALFIDTLVGANLRFYVYDSDTGIDDSIGNCTLSVIDVIDKNNFKQQSLTLKDVKTGTLVVKCGWLSFSNDVTKLEKNGTEGLAAVAALFVTIVNANNLPVIDFEKNTCNAYVEVTVGEKKKKSKTQRHTTSPVWNESFYFIIKEIQEDTKVNLKIIDHGCEEALGEITYPVANLLSKDKMSSKESFPLENFAAHKNSTLLVSFELKGLVPGEANHHSL